MIATILSLLLAAAAQDDMDVEGALLRFRKSYANTSTAARAAAVSDLARVTHEKSLNRLLPLLTGDTKEVRIAACKGLAGFSEQKKVVVTSLINALPSNAKELDVQCAIYESLGKLQDPAALAAIHKGFHETQIKVAKAAIAAAGAARAKESLDALFDLMNEVQNWIKRNQGGGYVDGAGAGDNAAKKARLEDLNKSIVEALQVITREKWGTVKEWEVWFRRFRPDFEVPK